MPKPEDQNFRKSSLEAPWLIITLQKHRAVDQVVWGIRRITQHGIATPVSHSCPLPVQLPLLTAAQWYLVAQYRILNRPFRCGGDIVMYVYGRHVYALECAPIPIPWNAGSNALRQATSFPKHIGHSSPGLTAAHSRCRRFVAVRAFAVRTARACDLPSTVIGPAVLA